MGNRRNRDFNVISKLFLSALMDLHDNYIVGYQLSEIHDIQLVEDTLLYAQK